MLQRASNLSLRLLRRIPPLRRFVPLLAILWALPASAQEGPTILQFSFSNPGARSLGFGGAFVALADDATAAFANPAGLIQLTRPELSLEWRQWSYSTPFTAGGRVSGPASGIGLDTAPGLRFDTSERDISGLSYLSFIYPFSSGALAIYRHQLANFEAFTMTDGLFTDVPGAPGFVSRFRDQRASWDFEVVTYGVAASWSLSERVSLGVGIGYNQIEFQGVTDVFTRDFSSFPNFFAPNPFTPERLDESLVLAGDDTHLTYNLGILWRLDSRWSLGSVYRSGFKFDTSLTNVAGAFDRLPSGTPILSVRDRVDFPDVFGLGAAYRGPGGALTVSFEWDHIRYSRIVETLDPNIFDAQGLMLDDADELHIGFEYAFLNARPLVALRCGLWFDPDHKIRIDGSNTDQAARAIFQPGENEAHLSFGAGIALKIIQLDLAVDLSDQIDTVAVSTIYAF